MMLRGCLCLALLVTACSCWWPFSDDSPEATASPEPSAQLETRTAVPFEMMTAEQKFLAQAQQFLDLPPLDKCQNQVSVLVSASGESIYKADTPQTLYLEVWPKILINCICGF